jgi:hypothetical protein
VFRDGPRPDAARAGDENVAGQQFRKHQAADAGGRALHPSQPRRLWKNVAIDERRERDVRPRKQLAQRVAIPGVEKRVVRKGAAQMVNEMSRHHPDDSWADDADDDVHGNTRSRKYEVRSQALLLTFDF